MNNEFKLEYNKLCAEFLEAENAAILYTLKNLI